MLTLIKLGPVHLEGHQADRCSYATHALCEVDVEHAGPHETLLDPRQQGMGGGGLACPLQGCLAPNNLLWSA